MMMLRSGLVAASLGAALALAPSTSALAQTVTAIVNSFQEVPAVSSAGNGRFRGDLANDAMEWRLGWSNLGSEVTQAHIHFGRRLTNGGIMVFLCSNLEGAPENVQPCPPGDGMISGTITADDIIGPADQGVEAGEFAELREAIRRNAAYVNVHTEGFPAGEIRGQITPLTRAMRAFD
jgi:hypothetical protein